MKKSQEETKNELKEGMQKGLEEMQKSQEETKNELKDKMEKEKINTVEDRIAGKMEEIAVVEEKREKKIEEKIERFTEEVAGNFNLVSQRVEDLEKKLLAGRNESKSKIVPVSAFPEPVPVTAFTGSVKLSTYDGKTNWEVYQTQFSIISEANGWTEGVKACQLAAFLRGEAAEILQTLPDTERMNLNSLYNVLDLRFGQKYSKDTHVCR
ncbi:uncharacterized protein TNCV_4803041 [Trichonephila clavipes]|nr:uncharacterized protein TNCV_4803041 [Trichonephila clavipes]